MKSARRATSLILAVSLLLPVGIAAAANHKPYFKVYGADVFTGGWFKSAGTCANDKNSSYQAPLYSIAASKFSGQTAYSGGIYGFAKAAGSRTGASSELGAFSLGLIEGQASTDYGFYSGTAGTNSLNFSNTNDTNDKASTYWGGFWEGTVRQSHCIPDYYGTKQNSPADLGGKTVGQLSTGQYKDTSGSMVTLVKKNAAETIAAGTKLTIFVNGDVFIGNNISYAGGYSESNVTKFALVARGNIYIGPNVSRLDGFYIAQPGSGGGGGGGDDQQQGQQQGGQQGDTSLSGFIWTCHDSNTTTPDGGWIKDNCSQKLTINGALSAKQVNLVRTPGDLAGAPANEGSGSGNIAEVVNYTPEMVVGGPFFNPPASAEATYKVQSIISLPPVF